MKLFRRRPHNKLKRFMTFVVLGLIMVAVVGIGSMYFASEVDQANEVKERAYVQSIFDIYQGGDIKALYEQMSPEARAGMSLEKLSEHIKTKAPVPPGIAVLSPERSVDGSRHTYYFDLYGNDKPRPRVAVTVTKKAHRVMLESVDRVKVD